MQLRVDFELLDKITAGYRLNHELCGMNASRRVGRQEQASHSL
jgi:hypothetical protein